MNTFSTLMNNVKTDDNMRIIVETPTVNQVLSDENYDDDQRKRVEEWYYKGIPLEGDSRCRMLTKVQRRWLVNMGVDHKCISNEYPVLNGIYEILASGNVEEHLSFEMDSNHTELAVLFLLATEWKLRLYLNLDDYNQPINMNRNYFDELRIILDNYCILRDSFPARTGDINERVNSRGEGSLTIADTVLWFHDFNSYVRDLYNSETSMDCIQEFPTLTLVKRVCALIHFEMGYYVTLFYAD